jgi:hypothetical protein
MFGDKAPEGKFLVLRRDGSVPEWPNFVLGARDPAAVAALLAYADAAEGLGYDDQFVHDVRRLAVVFSDYREDHGDGDPDAPPHREDDPEVIAKMRRGRMT